MTARDWLAAIILMVALVTIYACFLMFVVGIVQYITKEVHIWRVRRALARDVLETSDRLTDDSRRTLIRGGIEMGTRRGSVSLSGDHKPIWR